MNININIIAWSITFIIGDLHLSPMPSESVSKICVCVCARVHVTHTQIICLILYNSVINYN